MAITWTALALDRLHHFRTESITTLDSHSSIWIGKFPDLGICFKAIRLKARRTLII